MAGSKLRRSTLVRRVIKTLNLSHSKKTLSYFTKEQLIELNMHADDYNRLKSDYQKFVSGTLSLSKGDVK